MVLCVWYCGAPSLPLDTAVFSRVDGGVDWSCCAPSIPLDTAVFSRAGGGVEGMVLRGLALWCLLPSSGYCGFLSFGRWSRGYGPTGSGTVVPPPFLLTLLYSLVLTGEGRVWSSRVCSCCASFLPRDTAVFSFGSSYTCRYYGIASFDDRKRRPLPWPRTLRGLAGDPLDSS